MRRGTGTETDTQTAVTTIHFASATPHAKRNLYFKIGSVCLCHGQHAIGDRRYFLPPCDKREQTGNAQQQAASQASTDSAWRHPVWLPYNSLGFQRPAGRRSYHNKPRLTGEVCVTPQATIAQSAWLNCNIYWTMAAKDRISSYCILAAAAGESVVCAWLYPSTSRDRYGCPVVLSDNRPSARVIHYCRRRIGLARRWRPSGDVAASTSRARLSLSQSARRL